MALLECEFDSAVGVFAGDDADLAAGCGEGDGCAGEPASGGGGGGEEAAAGELSVSPGVALALLECEFDSAVGVFAGDDADLAAGCGEGDGCAGEPASGGGGGGEEAAAGELSVSPGVALALLECEFDSAVGVFAGDDADLAAGLLGGGGRRGERAGQDREQRRGG
ncbi:MAG: hypothetical protein OXG69_11420 [bacterium]|nr:hypothetical protein [bacterium]